MPYRWTNTTNTAPASELRLWPHQSLSPRGFAGFILATASLIAVPLLLVLGTSVLWGLLPFLCVAVAGLWLALSRNWHDRHILEILTLGPDEMKLTHLGPEGMTKEWHCNTYWARVEMHPEGGPVPFYVTIRGGGREVEIGAFLSEDERKALYGDLREHVRRYL